VPISANRFRRTQANHHCPSSRRLQLVSESNGRTMGSEKNRSPASRCHRQGAVATRMGCSRCAGLTTGATLSGTGLRMQRSLTAKRESPLLVQQRARMASFVAGILQNMRGSNGIRESRAGRVPGAAKRRSDGFRVFRPRSGRLHFRRNNFSNWNVESRELGEQK